MSDSQVSSRPASDFPIERSSQADQRAQMFANRLRKNLRRLAPWVAQRGLEAYRLYDRDIPEVRLIVERYGPSLVVWEYARGFADSERERADDRFLGSVLATLAEVCEVAPADIFVKRRQRQLHRGEAQRPRPNTAVQYEKLAQSRRELLVKEGGHRFLVNLSDYLDTGLFLDHRETRALVGKLASGKRVLNLFGYTGSFTVYAAGGGARGSLTIDLSSTYLDWARRNFAANGLDPARHRLLRADVTALLGSRDGREQAAALGREPFDLIILDPPTFSNSKRMQGTLDISRDHPQLIAQALRLLSQEGTLLFSCNHRRFTLRTSDIESELRRGGRGDAARGLDGGREPADRLSVRDVSQPTLPRDFHDPKTRCCFLIQRGGAGGKAATESPRRGSEI